MSENFAGQLWGRPIDEGNAFVFQWLERRMPVTDRMVRGLVGWAVRMAIAEGDTFVLEEMRAWLADKVPIVPSAHECMREEEP